MELPTVPRRRRWSATARVLLVVGVLAPVTLLALLPVALGLESYLIATDESGDSAPRGSVAIERMVPLGDVEVGDVITVPAATGSGEDTATNLTTREVVEVVGGVVTLESATRPGVRAEVASPSVSRLVVAVPWIGYPFLDGGLHPAWGVLAIGLGLGAVLLLVRHDAPRRRPRSVPSGSPAPPARQVAEL